MLVAELLCIDAVKIIFPLILGAVILYFAWRSTYVRSNSVPHGALFIIENRRNLFDQLSINLYDNRVQSSPNNNTETTVNQESPQSASTDPNSTSEIQNTTNLTNQSSISEIISVAASEESSSSTSEQLPGNPSNTDPGPLSIIEDMDRNEIGFEGIRKRIVPNDNTTEELKTSPSDSKMDSKNISASSDDPGEGSSKDIRIKLKYLNDDLKLVKGNPLEPLGDFKKRNFTVELAAQKVVRLVFNGHVLQPDTKTLEACGLFDNCVVHCLVHNQRTPANQNINNQIVGDTNRPIGFEGLAQEMDGQDETNHNQTLQGSVLIYLGISLVSATLVFCWFCRLQYNHLFSWYSTAGLILITVLFIVLFPLLLLIERDVVAT